MEEKNSSASAQPKQRIVKGKLIIDIQKCKGCELCTVACKEHALTLSDTINDKGYRYILADNDLCNGCVSCALVCPDAVITVYRTKPKKQKLDLSREEAQQALRTALTVAKNSA